MATRTTFVSSASGVRTAGGCSRYTVATVRKCNRQRSVGRTATRQSMVMEPPPCSIKVIGVGGAGGNAVTRMLESGLHSVEFLCANTDFQALSQFKSSPGAPDRKVVQLGEDACRGLGAGGDPSVGERAALESKNDISKSLQGGDLVFITAGMGGGTGTGAAPVVASIAKELGCLTVGVVTKPFMFEGRRRMSQGNNGLEKLRECVDTLIVVSNDKLLETIPKNTPLTDAFSVADDVLRQGVSGISDIILRPGLVNVDFADVRSVMEEKGYALLGIGFGTGESRAKQAATNAISSPLLDFPLTAAKGAVFNVKGGNDMTLSEVNTAAEVIYGSLDANANIIFGAVIDDEYEGTMSVTVVATGFS